MRLKLRIHEWLADRFQWVQYPKPSAYKARPSLGARLAYRWRYLNAAQRGWVFFFIFWGAVVMLSIYGNLID